MKVPARPGEPFMHIKYAEKYVPESAKHGTMYMKERIMKQFIEWRAKQNGNRL
jgi:hypothetical protein